MTIDPPVLLANQGHRGPGRPHRAPEVDVVGLLPDLVGILDGAADGGIAGIVDENVQAPEVRRGVVDEAFDVLAPAHVGDAREHLAAGCLDRRLRLVEGPLAARADRDPGPFPGELHRNRLAEAEARGGHRGNLVIQSEIHCRFLLDSLSVGGLSADADVPGGARKQRLS